MPSTTLPIPPLELRAMVGPTDPKEFDNPRGEPIYQPYGIPLSAYETVFDFGCGCGRVARQLLQQQTKPRRYVGIDPSKKMIEWCTRNLSPIDEGFRFAHHDVYSQTYAPLNTMQLSEPFPVRDGEFSLLIAHSVFTHLCRQQTEFYLSEVARVLAPDGVAFTSWFFFDNDSFRFLPEGPFCLYTSEAFFDQAVIYDRRWFIQTLRRLKLRARSTRPPDVPGYQWVVLIERRKPSAADDHFPLGEEAAEWVCGATSKPMATGVVPPLAMPGTRDHPSDSQGTASDRPRRPSLFGTLAELEAMKRSWSWRIGRGLTAPVRKFKEFVGR